MSGCWLREKLCTAEAAVALINDGVTVVSGGFVGAAHPEALTAALERRFQQCAHPRDLTLVYAAGQGDGKTRGLNHLAHAGLLRRVIGGHWGLAPRLSELALANQIEAYNLPQGVICQLLRDIAAGRPGCITHVGLGTFIDPIQQGGRLNARTPAGLVERVELGGQTWLWYKAFPIHVGLIRATGADPHGGLVMDDEAIIGEVLAIAEAVHNSGGIVIAQVARLLASPASPKNIRVPGIFVDRVVVAEPHEHEQTFAESFNPCYCEPAPVGPDFEHQTLATGAEPMPLDERRIIASRVCDELTDGAVANLGIGMPEGVARIAAERGLLQRCTLTVESGPIDGLRVAIAGGRLRIVQEGRVAKFVERVEQVSFSAQTARQKQQQVLYVTERAVFRLAAEGLELIEVAPGIELETQVIGVMRFRPMVRQVRPMPASALAAASTRTGVGI
ncbi:MAG: hypothetical protein NTY19_32555 [Planctomycetota bacterium]|nr:hypothetical protein [Planctomycetota bacterium]